MFDRRDPMLWVGLIIGVLPWAILLIVIWEAVKWLVM